MWRYKSSLLCLGILMLSIVGCSSQIRQYQYRLNIPKIRVHIFECPSLGPGTRCASVRLDELRDLIIELKTACIALGGTREECHIPKDLR